ncbi:hypothetical protein B0H11DRAFT_1921636 [Mycena galericulata]|nr:hypothetical protein B0H11DRAFT_1921636 [Mycena galericulata]
MGRTPKYLTVDEAAAGHRARVGKYDQRPSTKRARVAARQPRTLRKKAKTSRPPLPPPPPPADVAVAPRDPRIAQWRAFPLPDEAPVAVVPIQRYPTAVSHQQWPAGGTAAAFPGVGCRWSDFGCRWAISAPAAAQRMG